MCSTTSTAINTTFDVLSTYLNSSRDVVIEMRMTDGFVNNVIPAQFIEAKHSDIGVNKILDTLGCKYIQNHNTF